MQQFSSQLRTIHGYVTEKWTDPFDTHDDLQDIRADYTVDR